MRTLTRWDPQREMEALQKRCARLFALALSETAELAGLSEPAERPASAPAAAAAEWTITLSVAQEGGARRAKGARARLQK